VSLPLGNEAPVVASGGSGASGPPTNAAEEASAYPELGDALVAIRSRMGSDTATVLLLDRTRTVLEPAATVGLESTLRRAPRVPLGHGFAGRVAQIRQPVVVADVRDSAVINPVLRNHGVRSLLGVPLTVGSELLGVLHVGFLQHHDFDDTEKRVLTELAGELGAMLHRRFSEHEHTAALTLQRSLLPTALSVPPSIAMAARYIPADGDLGGDWYDVFELPDRRLGLVMGDVIGHGLEAAIVMGRLRSALRAYALDHDDPAEVLTRLDRKICHFEPDALATVVYGVSSAPYDTWHFSSAGHFAPLVGASGGSVASVDMAIDRLLGLSPDAARHSTEVRVPEGGLLCLFTDGLVERRPRADDGDADIIGDNIDRLAAALAQGEGPEMACIRALADVVGDHVTEDDLAVLVAQRLD
jgi:phosphoserine phosphatase RsbU/P